MQAGKQATTKTKRQGPAVRELAHRCGTGIEVSLIWRRIDDAVLVQLVEVPSGVVFELAVAPENALDAFYHPYAYLAGHTVVPWEEPVAA
jgi:hypothetical protein